MLRFQFFMSLCTRPSVKIDNLKLYKVGKKARIDTHGDHSKGYEDTFQYTAMIHKYDHSTICKVLYNVLTKPDKIWLQRIFMALST